MIAALRLRIILVPIKLNWSLAATECAMLVLTRKLQQQIKIGEQITVTILRVKGNAVRVGVQAPRDVRVVRGELPKDGAKTLDATPTEEAVVASGESANDSARPVGEVASAPAGEAPKAAAAAPAASHLPLRRIRNRHGTGPLKQVIASCATLAK
jgi:carbon storage regulator CsrA